MEKNLKQQTKHFISQIKNALLKFRDHIKKYYDFFNVYVKVNKLSPTSQDVILVKMGEETSYDHSMNIARFLNEKFTEDMNIIVYDNRYEFDMLTIMNNDVILCEIENDSFSYLNQSEDILQLQTILKDKFTDMGFENSLMLKPIDMEYNTIEKEILLNKLNKDNEDS